MGVEVVDQCTVGASGDQARRGCRCAQVVLQSRRADGRVGHIGFAVEVIGQDGGCGAGRQSIEVEVAVRRREVVRLQVEGQRCLREGIGDGPERREQERQDHAAIDGASRATPPGVKVGVHRSAGENAGSLAIHLSRRAVGEVAEDGTRDRAGRPHREREGAGRGQGAIIGDDADHSAASLTCHRRDRDRAIGTTAAEHDAADRGESGVGRPLCQSDRTCGCRVIANHEAERTCAGVGINRLVIDPTEDGRRVSHRLIGQARTGVRRTRRASL